MGGGVNMEKEKYDVVVIGAGAGGISAGAFLAQAGYKTLVVEQLPFVGGRGSSIKYKGYNISTGAGGWLLQLKEDIFDPLGAPFDVRIPKPNTAYYIGGKCYEMPEKGKLRSALSVAVNEEEADRIMKLMYRALSWELPSNKISLRDWLLQYTDDERVIDVFKANWQVEEVGAGYPLLTIKTMKSMDYGYAVNGNRSMWEAIADVVHSNNGDVWTRARTDKILIEDGIVKGVIVTKNLLKKSEEQVQIDAQAVVSNIGPFGTINLGGEENFDKGHIMDVQETIKTFPWLAFQVASSAPLIESPAVGFVVGAKIVNWILSPTLLCPELAPEGKHITYVGAWIPPNGPWDFSKYLKQGIDDLKEICPDYDKYVDEILHVAYFIRQSWPMYHSYDGHSLPSQKTSVQNLYNVGDAVFAPGKVGQPGAAMSGRMVAEDIEQRIKPM
jgi:phytoene desaturase